MKQKLQTPYYSRLTRMSFLLFTIFVLTFCSISCLVAWNSKRADFLRPYDQTLDMLKTAYEAKQRNMYQLIMPLIASDQLSVMGDFFSDKSDGSLSDYYFMQKMLAQLRNAARHDEDISAIYLYKPCNRSFYRYSVSKDVFGKISSSDAFCGDYLSAQDVRMTTGTLGIPYRLSGSKTTLAESLYAIGSRALMLTAGGSEKPGIFFCYNADAFKSILESRSLSDGARFYLFTTDGHIIFDSRSEYAENSYTELPNMGNLVSDSATVTVSSERCIKSVYTDSSRGYSALYYIPEKTVWRQIMQTEVLLLLCAAFCIVVIALLLFASGRAFSLRMSMLTKGMAKVGGNDLNYRLPVRKENDEFSFISTRFNDMCAQLQKEVKKTYLSNIRRQKAEFYAMQTSINPHFLYNTLEIFRQKLHERGDPQMEEMLLLLSRLFHYQTHGYNYVMLADELENLQTYLDFFTIWYGDRFSYEVDIPDELLIYGIPKYTLQPIVENFFLHGLRPGDANQIMLTAKKEREDILIEVRDNGLGISPEKLKELWNLLYHETDAYHHLGLVNVHERVLVTFGEGHGLTVDSPGVNLGTTVRIRMRAMSVENLRRQVEESEQ